MGLLGALLERFGLRQARPAPKAATPSAPPRPAPRVAVVEPKPAPHPAPHPTPPPAATPAQPQPQAQPPAESPAQTPVAPLPAATAAPAAGGPLTPEQEAAKKREHDLEELKKSFRSSLVDPRFQALDIDTKFLDELGALVLNAKSEFSLPPAAAFDVMRILDTSSYQVQKVAAAISCDPTLAGAVLSMANSPLHRGEIPVESVPSSVVRLGQRHLKLLLLDIALHSTRVHGKPYEAFSAALWKHSLLTAQIATRIAPMVRVDADHAYMAGLLHDIGSFAVLGVARRLALRQERKISAQTLLAAIKRWGYDLNGVVVSKWRLPEGVAKAVATRRNLADAGDSAPLAAVTELANELSRPLGAWVETREIDLPSHPAVAALQVDLSRLPQNDLILELALKVERVAHLG